MREAEENVYKAFGTMNRIQFNPLIPFKSELLVYDRRREYVPTYIFQFIFQLFFATITM